VTPAAGLPWYAVETSKEESRSVFIPRGNARISAAIARATDLAHARDPRRSCCCCVRLGVEVGDDPVRRTPHDRDGMGKEKCQGDWRPDPTAQR
jgi:hypothetical protein